MQEVNWLKNLDTKVFGFVHEMSENNFARFKYSLTGDLYNHRTRWGLGQAVFAVKTLYMIDKLKNIDEVKTKNVTEFIKSFQRTDGYTYDPLVSKLSFFSNFKQFLRQGSFDVLKNIQTKRKYLVL